MKNYDFGKTAADYARHRAGFPARFFDQIFQGGTVRPGDSVLDLGTGTGTLARGLALRGCNVTALDPSAEMLTEARRLDGDAGVTIQYRQAAAEATGLPEGEFDAATAGQCWHWFDRRVAANEALRVLKPRGAIIIAHFDWIPLPGNVVESTEHLIHNHNPKWNLDGGTGIHPLWFSDLAVAGFENLEAFAFDEAVRYSHDGWRGRIRASAGVGASLAPDEVARSDTSLGDMLREKFPEDPLIVPHRVWAIVARKPGRDG